MAESDVLTSKLNYCFSLYRVHHWTKNRQIVLFQTFQINLPSVKFTFIKSLLFTFVNLIQTFVFIHLCIFVCIYIKNNFRENVPNLRELISVMNFFETLFPLTPVDNRKTMVFLIFPLCQLH